MTSARITRWLAYTILGYAVLAASCAGIDTRALEDAIFSNRPLDEATVASGLKEALKVGTERSVDATSVVDGFLGNALIRIAVPEQFDDVAGALRKIGFGGKVDEMEVAMNRAAELAAGEAKGVFWSAVAGMSIADAFAILQGEDNAATLYFRDKTETELAQRFEPIVEDKMQEVGLYNLYEEITDLYDRLPFIDKPALDLQDYVTDKALDGLFITLSAEEKRIREDPIARSSELLKRVFGSQDS